MIAIRAFMLIADDEPSLQDIRFTREEIENLADVDWWLAHGGRIVEVEIREVRDGTT
jgi:hypothetical protein